MERLLSSIESNIREAYEILSTAEPYQFDSSEAESFCEALAETVDLMEKNAKECEQVFEGYTELLDQIKYAAVCVHKCIPYLNKVDEILSGSSDDIHEAIGAFMDIFEEKSYLAGGGNV